MMAAGTAAGRGLKVQLLERNDRPGRKLMITGKGRCNVTNARPTINEMIDAVPVNGRFLYGAFSRFMPEDTINFFETLGVPLKTERGNRVFPESDRASDIVDALNGFTKSSGAKRIKARAVSFKIEEGKILSVFDETGAEYAAESFVVATGGASYPATGSTGDGYILAKQAGHTVSPLKPSLVPLECAEAFCRDLQGLTLKNVGIKIIDNSCRGGSLHPPAGRLTPSVYSDFGEMLFTHFGVSGPVILSASSHIKNIEKSKYTLYIDLKPALSEEQLDARVLRDLLKYANKNLLNSLNELLPKALIPVIIGLAGLDPDIKSNRFTKEMRRAFVGTVKALPVNITGFRPIEEAVITSGGVRVNEIEPGTMRSKIIPNLYFAGEVIDVDAYTGGYNLQIAFSTGRLAGEAI